MNVIAVDKVPLGDIGGPGLGPFGSIARDAGTGLAGITDAISSMIGIITISAAIWFFFQLLTAGLNWLTSGGEKTKLSEARDRMTNAFMGLIIVVAAYAIVAIVGQVLGFVDILVPTSVINNLKIK